MSVRTGRNGVLDGVRVADFSRVLAGPYATMALADFGADVLKIEPPTGDDTRHWHPPVDADGTATDFGCWASMPSAPPIPRWRIARSRDSAPARGRRSPGTTCSSRTIANPIRLGDAPAAYRTPPPALNDSAPAAWRAERT